MAQLLGCTNNYDAPLLMIEVGREGLSIEKCDNFHSCSDCLYSLSQQILEEHGKDYHRYANVKNYLGVALNAGGKHWTLLVVEPDGNAYHMDSLPGFESHDRVKLFADYVHRKTLYFSSNPPSLLYAVE